MYLNMHIYNFILLACGALFLASCSDKKTHNEDHHATICKIPNDVLENLITVEYPTKIDLYDKGFREKYLAAKYPLTSNSNCQLQASRSEHVQTFAIAKVLSRNTEDFGILTYEYNEGKYSIIEMVYIDLNKNISNKILVAEETEGQFKYSIIDGDKIVVYKVDESIDGVLSDTLEVQRYYLADGSAI